MRRSSFSALVFGLVLIALAAPNAGAQASPQLERRVIVSSALTGAPIAGATITDSATSVTARSNAAGEFTWRVAGRITLTIQAIGFVAQARVIENAAADTAVIRIALQPISQTLNEVPIIAAAPVRGRLSEFEERRAFGAGRFVTDSMLRKNDNRNLSEVIATLPGLRVTRGMGNAGWIAGTRGSGSTRNSGFAPSEMDKRKGARPGCYSTVMLDGGYVFSNRSGEMLFDVNSLQTSQIAGIEYYPGASSVPVKFRGADTGCGLLIIWTR
jgi:hypothetical protein